jgi:hypothetical protein
MMGDLSAAAAALGIPEGLVQRSAAARAEATGMSVDEVLAAWAGGGGVPPEAPAPQPVETGGPTTDEPREATPVPMTEARPAKDEEPPRPVVTESLPVLSEVTTAQAASLAEVITVATAGIRERMNFPIPRWLVATMLIIPAFALFSLGNSATGTCGEATELAVDVISGEIVNCDGSAFEGSGVGGGGPDLIVLGDRVYNGIAVAGVNCAGCHGATGGGGVGPALGGVLTTFGSCASHLEWVEIGSPGFQAQGRTTYGDTAKPVNGGMPPHATLSAEQLAAVTAFERVRFGGADPDSTLADCGLAPPDGATPEGDVPADGTQAGSAQTG